MNKYYQNNKIDWVFRNIKYRCENPKNYHYNWYGKRGVKCLITKEELKKLWNRDKAEKMEKPTIDRINNKGHYIFDNCRFIEQSENSSKDKEISILQLRNNKIIKEWKSLAQVFRKLKIPQSNICHVLKGRRQTAGGFKWRYKNEKYI